MVGVGRSFAIFGGGHAGRLDAWRVRVAHTAPAGMSRNIQVASLRLAMATSWALDTGAEYETMLTPKLLPSSLTTAISPSSGCKMVAGPVMINCLSAGTNLTAKCFRLGMPSSNCAFLRLSVKSMTAAHMRSENMSVLTGMASTLAPTLIFVSFSSAVSVVAIIFAWTLRAARGVAHAWSFVGMAGLGVGESESIFCMVVGGAWRGSATPGRRCGAHVGSLGHVLTTLMGGLVTGMGAGRGRRIERVVSRRGVRWE